MVATQPTMSSVDLLVLGAGTAGLMAARRAARRGLSVLVVEQADAIGGRAASFEVAGVRVDFGSRRLDPTIDADLLTDLRALIGPDLQTRPRTSRLQVAGRWLSVPLQAREVARTLPRSLTLQAARDVALAPGRRARQDTYAQVLRAGLGPALYDVVHGPYARKVWGVDGDRLDGEQARRRVAADRPLRVAQRLVRNGWQRRSTGEGSVFYYPRNGFGQIVEALAEAAVADGARILTSAPVRTLHARPDGARMLWDGGEVHAAQVFSTLPLTSLGRVARPAPSAQVVGDASGLGFRAVVLVYLVHEGGRWTSMDAHYLPGPQTPVSRVSEPTNYRSNPNDPTDRTVLCAELPCTVGDTTWTARDDDLTALVLDGLGRAGLPPIRLAEVQVRRLPQVYPVYVRGYAARLAGLAAWADRLAHVTTFGRLGLFVHDNSAQALRMGWDAADCLRTGSGSPGFDQVAWQAARERFSRHVVQD